MNIYVRKFSLSALFILCLSLSAWAAPAAKNKIDNPEDITNPIVSAIQGIDTFSIGDTTNVHVRTIDTNTNLIGRIINDTQPPRDTRFLSATTDTVNLSDTTFEVYQAGSWKVERSDTKPGDSSSVQITAVNPSVRFFGDTKPKSDTHSRNFIFRTDTFTVQGESSPIQDISTQPMLSYALQVKGTGAAPTAWDVRIEGSLDRKSFTQILQHTNTSGDGSVVFSGATLSAVLYIRVRVAGLTLGLSDNIVVTLLAVQ